MSLPPLPLSFLGALLLAAVVCDLRRRRIPNMLVLYGLGLGLAFQSLAPAGAGLLQGGGLGLGAALLGGLCGLALFLPFYALRMLGAGDVKLLAMVGVWLGAAAVAQAAVWTMLAGAAMALAVMTATQLRHGLPAFSPVRPAHAAEHAEPGTTPSPRSDRRTRLPYAVAIAAGTAIEIGRLLSAA